MENPKCKSGAETLVRCLEINGTDTVFGYPGSSVLDVYDALSRSNIRHVLCTCEQQCAHAADAYARVTGKPGVVLATGGPGATNLVTGIAGAFADSVPLVAVTGNAPLPKLGKDSFQEVDITGITMPITKYGFIIKEPDSLPSVVSRAFGIAQSGRRGPVLVDVPQDVAAAPCLCAPRKAEIQAPPKPDAKSLSDAAKIVNESRRPLILAGGGAAASRAGRLIKKLADTLDCPVCATMMGLSAVDGRDKRFMGMTGKYGSPAAEYAIKRCDALIALGCRFSDRQTENLKYKNLVHIDIDDAEIDKRCAAAVGIAADVSLTLEAILPSIAEKRGFLNEVLSKAPTASVTSSALAKSVAQTVSDLMPKDALVVSDVGRHQIIAANLLRLPPESFITSGGMGEMGYGVGAAVGAYLGSGRPIILFTGDGSLMFGIAELANAVRLGVKLVVAVFDDDALGLVKQWQNERFKNTFETAPRLPVDFKAAAEAFGARGFKTATAAGFRKAFSAALDSALSGIPALVDLKIKKEITVKPLF